MVIAQNLEIAIARGTVRIDQHLRIDLEMLSRVRVNVRCSPGLHYPFAMSQEYAATFQRMGAPRFG